ncbi:hypothetical protein TorRG33x02_307840 [Trema orientale]|uniref:Uncharacterized protein n=1 Tax=Trema orientale TaxID=63057 RepID=A0A2P5BV06_TREOI|nr:hypothetical protein TorRG33x02_307840 [Trema orientale]
MVNLTAKLSHPAQIEDEFQTHISSHQCVPMSCRLSQLNDLLPDLVPLHLEVKWANMRPSLFTSGAQMSHVAPVWAQRFARRAGPYNPNANKSRTDEGKTHFYVPELAFLGPPRPDCFSRLGQSNLLEMQQRHSD